MDSIDSKEKAQSLINQIIAFRNELSRLKHAHQIVLPTPLDSAIATHQTNVIEGLQKRFLVDVDAAEARMSLGIKIASALGAIALSFAVFFLFSELWPHLSTPVRISVLIGAPVLTTLATFWTLTRDRSGYFGSILGLLTFCLFVLNLSLMGSMFNLPSSPRAFLVWGIAGLMLAYGYGFRLLLYAGLLCLLGYLSAQVGVWNGCYWLDFGNRPENFLLAGILITLGSFIPARGEHSSFPVAYKVVGLLTLFFSILIVSNWGELSYLPWSPESIAHLYQILAFLIWGAAIAAGVRKHDTYFTNMGIVFFTIHLYTKVYDWFWSWLPKYLFFFLIFLIFLLALMVLTRLRKYRVERTVP